MKYCTDENSPGIMHYLLNNRQDVGAAAQSCVSIHGYKRNQSSALQVPAFTGVGQKHQSGSRKVGDLATRILQLTV